MIREARAEDYQKINDLKNKVGIDRSRLHDSDYRTFLENNGFLLFPDYELVDFTQDLQKTFLVYEGQEGISGYIRIDTEPELSTEGDVEWLREDMKPHYYAEPHSDLGGIAVARDTYQRGIGTSLLQEAEKQITTPYLFSFVVTAPIKNTPSILFHEKNGFEKIAIINSPENFGLKNYQSILYGKKL